MARTHFVRRFFEGSPELLVLNLIEPGRIAPSELASRLTHRVEMLLDHTRHTGTRLLRLRLAGVALVPLILALDAARVPAVFAFASPAPAPPPMTPARLQFAPAPAPVPAPAQAQAKPADPTVEQWIKANAIPLTTVEAGHGFADMQPLKKIVGNARIVALGEATHGTREFFQVKHRMVEFLATQMGFTIFSIEANMPEAYRLNDYVLNGVGDPAALLKGMYFWTWDTKEVLDMILWMREFNKSGKGRIEFTGFDMQTPTVAAKIVRDFAAQNDPEYSPVIQKAAQASATAANQAGQFGSDTGNFPVEDAAGKTVRLSANIKTQDVTNYAGLWWRADGRKDGGMKALVFRNLGDAAPKGTTDWKHYELEAAVPPETTNINFGVLLAGGGTAWFKGLAVEVDGKPYTQAQGFDLIHRGLKMPAGVFTVGPGYAGVFDATLLRSDPEQTLKITRTAPLDPAAGTQSKEASAKWHEILDHMQASRATWLSKGVSAKDADWAIQNARVVLQSIQMKTNEISRDRAMADNVKWILDHSPPQTKIVLWAHNGHVGTRTQFSYKQMGAELRDMYGDQMVVFGFAFNQGSFQSIEQGKGLRNFTVSAAPSGGFDATLASAGIPLLALDLTHAAAGSPAAAWLNEAHKARGIGAVYSEDQPLQYFNDLIPQSTYNAILFVEHTTAAVPNPPSANAAIVSCSGQPASQSCHDKEYKVSFSLPAGWSVKNSWRWGDMENTVALTDPQTIPGQMNPSLWYRVRLTPLKRTLEANLEAFRKQSEAKVAMRQGAGLADYHLRPDSCHSRTVGGLPAYSCIGEFTDQSGQSMAEYLTFVESENSSALFFGLIPASGLDAYIKRFDAIIETLQIP